MNDGSTDKITSWNIDAGTYVGTLIEAGEYTQHTQAGEKRYFRLVFTIDDKPHEYFEYHAQKRYPLASEYPPELAEDLKYWLGAEFFAQNPNPTWEQIIGMKARLTIKHVHSEGHSKPYVYISKIAPLKKASKKIIIAPRIDVGPCVQQEAA